MNRRAKVELFEQIRHEYEFGVGTIKGVAEKFGVHRRTVRQALECSLPPERKRPVRQRAVLEPALEFINQILDEDARAPRKQRHTAKRIWARILTEVPGCRPAETTVREYVRERKRALALLRREVSVPQTYQPGQQAQVDWYDAVAGVDDLERKVSVFSMRSMYSGAAFHRAYPAATQQAFFEAHELAFAYFGGVFTVLRYDNLSSAVRRILRGIQREEATRFIAFRSHYQFEASFCTPAKGNEKGGVEGEVGYFRRNHLVPVPRVSSFEELNERLLAACHADHARRITGRSKSVGELLVEERPHLLALPAEGFQIAEESFPRVDSKGCVRVRNNFYSTPLVPGVQPRVRVLPQSVEVWFGGRRVAAHPRCYGQYQHVLDLEHYLDVLSRKPGALAGAEALRQWRESGRWPEAYDRLWEKLCERHGRSHGTRAMVELLESGREVGYDHLTRAIEQALDFGCIDPAAVRYLLRMAALGRPDAAPIDVGELERYTRPAPEMSVYDELLEAGRVN